MVVTSIENVLDFICDFNAVVGAHKHPVNEKVGQFGSQTFGVENRSRGFPSVVVPRLFEMLRARIIKAIEKDGGLPAYLLHRALAIETKRYNGKSVPWDMPMDGILSLTLRKKVRAERRKVADAGVQLRRLVGDEIRADDWALFLRCYRSTYAAHHSTPYLNARFYSQLAATMAPRLLMVVASLDGDDIAAALALLLALIAI